MKIPFVQERRKRWIRLHELLKKIETSQLTSFSKEALIELTVLYRQTATDLSLAKSQNLPDELIQFLNDLVSRAYHQIYRTEKSTLRQFKNLIALEFPSLFRRNWRVILFSFFLLICGWSLGFFGYLTGPDVVQGLLPKGFAANFIKEYKNKTWFNYPFKARPYISLWIMQNNIKVAMGAFAGGMLMGTYTCFIILLNGFILGALSAVFWTKGYFLSFWAMILPHGVIELTAIGLAAAAGFLLTRAILFPGEYSRQNALMLNGLQAVKLLGGTVFLFVIAALIEGFFSTITTKVIPEYVRLIFAGKTAVFLWWYLSLGKRSKKPPLF